MDECALLWAIHWPEQGTVKDYADNFFDYVMRKSDHCDVSLTSDRYYDHSIKSVTRGARAGKNASRRHHLILSSPLPPQKIVLTVDENKRQLTDIICEYTVERARANEEPARHKLLVSGREPLPLELLRGHKRNREDLRTTHEETGVTMMYQGIQSARSGVQSVKVISDDTDVFALLMHFSIQNKKSRSFIIEAQVKRVSQLIYTHP